MDVVLLAIARMSSLVTGIFLMVCPRAWERALMRAAVVSPRNPAVSEEDVNDPSWLIFMSMLHFALDLGQMSERTAVIVCPKGRQ